MQSLIPIRSTSIPSDIHIKDMPSDPGEVLLENTEVNWGIITGWLWTDKLFAEIGAAERDKIA
jgi:hypothetical protein